MRKRGKGKSLKNRLMGLIVLCGIVPILFIVLFVARSYRKGIVEKTDAMVENEMQYVAALISGRLNHAIDVLSAVSCDESYEKAWRDYYEGKSDQTTFCKKIESRLTELLRLEQRYDAFTFYGRGQETPICCGESHESFCEPYIEQIAPVVKQVQKAEQREIEVATIKNHIFIVCNLYTASENEMFGTLALELDTERLFREADPGVIGNMAIYLNDTHDRIMIAGSTEKEWDQNMEQKLWEKAGKNPDREQTSVYTLKYSGYMKNQLQKGYRLRILFLVENAELYLEVYEFYRVILVVILVMMSVFFYALYFFKIHISEPITKMIDTAKTIEQGAIGTTVCGEKMPNQEFEYLREAFDKMSKQIKYLFDYAYDEKMARKDAKIMALQAQINPHFLNNTLEMMNWQARMSGAWEVSSMIESLGIVLDYNTNRESKRLTTLAQELRCADAYFHIISKRFGKRLVVEKEIRQELLSAKVPQLVLQPMIENAVTHGIEHAKEGVIRIRIYKDAEKLYLQVMNTGKSLTEEEKEKIELLLKKKPEEIEKGVGYHVSLAIRNINERVKLIYGEEYGLTIAQEGEYIVSTIVIPIQVQDEERIRDGKENARWYLEEARRF